MLFFFLRLYLAHMLGDFPLQTEYIFRLKTTKLYIGALPHIIIHIAIMCIMMFPFLYSWRALGCILFIAIIHYLSDTKKVDVSDILTRNKKSPYYQLLYFGIDQLIHLVTIFLAVSLFFFPQYYLDPLFRFPEPLMSIYMYNDRIVFVLIFIIFGVYGTPAIAYIVSGLFFEPENVRFKESWKSEFLQKLYRLLLMVILLLPGWYVYFVFIPLFLNIYYIATGKHYQSYSYFKDIITTLIVLILAIIMRVIFHHVLEY